MIFYEAPHKLQNTLEDFQSTFGGERPIALCRELTKLHEEVRRCTIDQAVTHYSQNSPRGEFVLVIGGAEPSEEGEPTLEEGLALVEKLRETEALSLRDAVKRVAKELKLSRNELYQAAISQ